MSYRSAGTKIEERACAHRYLVGMSDDILSEKRVFKTGEIVAGKFQIIEHIGSGGMGSVYRAYNATLEHTVALKIIHPHLTDSPGTRTRFLREVKALAAVSDDNLVRIFLSGQTEDGLLYMALEHVPGETLDLIIKRDGALLPQLAVRVAMQVCRGMAKAHAAGVVHRDLKPGNISVSENNLVKVLDFGIARTDTDAGGITRTGVLVGSPAYMSPEQCRGQEVDARSDIYSLGCVLYEMLCGFPPVNGDSALAAMAAHLEGEVQSVPSPHAIPQRLRDIVLKCLAKAPEDRFESMDDLKNNLSAIDWDCSKLIKPAIPRETRRWGYLPYLVAGGLIIALPVAIFFVHSAKSKSVQPSDDVAPLLTNSGDAEKIECKHTPSRLPGRTEVQDMYPDVQNRLAFYRNWLSDHEKSKSLEPGVRQFYVAQATYQIFWDLRKFDLGKSEEIENQRQRALQLCEEILKKDPTYFGRAYFLQTARAKAAMLEYSNELEQSVKCLEDALARSKEDSAFVKESTDCYLQIAECKKRQNKYDEAEKLLQKVLKEIPFERQNAKQISGVMVSLSDVYHHEGRPQEALELFKDADENISWQKALAKEDWEARGGFLSKLATELKEKCHYVEAASLFDEAAPMYLQTEKRKKNGVACLTEAADCWQSAGNTREANRAFRQAIVAGVEYGQQNDPWNILNQFIRCASEEQRKDGILSSMVKEAVAAALRQKPDVTDPRLLGGVLEASRTAMLCRDTSTARSALMQLVKLINLSPKNSSRSFAFVLPACDLAMSLQDEASVKTLLAEQRARLGSVRLKNPESEQLRTEVFETMYQHAQAKDKQTTGILWKALAEAKTLQDDDVALDIVNAQTACCADELTAQQLISLIDLCERASKSADGKVRRKGLQSMLSVINVAVSKADTSVVRNWLTKAALMSKLQGESLLTVDKIYCMAGDMYFSKKSFKVAAQLYRTAIESRPHSARRMEGAEFDGLQRKFEVAKAKMHQERAVNDRSPDKA